MTPPEQATHVPNSLPELCANSDDSTVLSSCSLACHAGHTCSPNDKSTDTSAGVWENLQCSPGDVVKLVHGMGVTLREMFHLQRRPQLRFIDPLRMWHNRCMTRSTTTWTPTRPEWAQPPTQPTTLPQSCTTWSSRTSSQARCEPQMLMHAHSSPAPFAPLFADVKETYMAGRCKLGSDCAYLSDAGRTLLEHACW